MKSKSQNLNKQYTFQAAILDYGTLTLEEREFIQSEVDRCKEKSERALKQWFIEAVDVIMSDKRATELNLNTAPQYRKAA